jgi:Fe-S cluster assembly ATPase SufC
MLKIERLHAEIDCREILKCLKLSGHAGEVHATTGAVG